MQWKRTLHMVNAHAAGEVGNVITGGVLNIPGKTMLDKMNYLNEEDDSLRRLVIFEPRGKAQMGVCLLLPPTIEEADAGMIVMHADRCHSMSGSNCICTVTVLLETGILPMQEPFSEVVLDTPAGLVKAIAECRNGKCVQVQLDMVPAFVDRLDQTLKLPDIGEIKVDVVFGGVYYLLCNVQSVGLKIMPNAARKLAELGAEILAVAQKEIQVCHPLHPSINNLAYVMFTDYDSSNQTYHNATTLSSRVDRSPCGTGTSARLAAMHARQQVGLQEEIIFHSIIGSQFKASIKHVGKIADKTTCHSVLSGQGWIFGFQEIALDPSDPFPLGFSLNDMWG